jgi:CRISPR system Cascade subunit CasE
MYFSRVTIVPQLLSQRQLHDLLKGDHYAEHQMLWQLFDDDKRQYLFRREHGTEQPYANIGQNDALPVYYLVSKHPPIACDGLQLLSKPYQPQLAVGTTLGFSLRANPIVAKKVQGKKNSLHHDVMMDAKLQAKQQQLDGPQSVEYIANAGKQWLLGRADKLGFTMNTGELDCDGYMQHRFYKKKGKSDKPIRISTLDYNGLLTVTDPEKFKQTLFEGIGRAKAFGCGLMMIRRV